MRSQQVATLPHGEPPSWRRGMRMNGLAARSTRFASSTGGRLRRDDGFHADGVVDEFEEV